MSSANSISEEFILARQEKIYLLYRSGLTQTTISKLLSVSLCTVAKDINAFVVRLSSSTQNTINQMRLIQVDRLHYLEERISTQVQKGDLKAVQLALNLASSKSKLLGLDSGEEVQLDNFPIEVSSLEVELETSGQEQLSGAKRKSTKLSDLDDEALRELYFQKLQESNV